MTKGVMKLGLAAWALVSCWNAARAGGQLPPDIARQVIRGIDNDVALPRDAEEYQATGKNAVLMLDSRSAISTELPLRAVYLIHQNVRIPLQRLVSGVKHQGPDGHSHQVSFYLLPIQFMKLNSRLLADFSGSRAAFGITNFSPQRAEDFPAFARLDEYDAPEDPDMAAVASLLVREFPEQSRDRQ